MRKRVLRAPPPPPPDSHPFIGKENLSPQQRIPPGGGERAGGRDLNQSVIMVKQHAGCSLLGMETHFHQAVDVKLISAEPAEPDAAPCASERRDKTYRIDSNYLKKYGAPGIKVS